MSRPLLVLGASGTLGQKFSHAAEGRGVPYHAYFRSDLDLSDPAAVERMIAEIRPWAVINATVYVRVDEAEADESGSFETNTEARCASPLNVNGRSKAAMEKRVLAVYPGALVARTSAFFGPRDSWNFVTQTLQAPRRGEAVVLLPDDAVVSPTYVPDLVAAAFDLLINGANGVWHLTNAGQTNWAEFARSAAGLGGMDAAGVRACSHRELSQAVPRPCYSALGTEKSQILPSFEAALARYAEEVSRPPRVTLSAP